MRKLFCKCAVLALTTALPAHVDCRPRHNVRGWSFNGTTFEVKGRKTGIGKAIGKGIQP